MTSEKQAAAARAFAEAIAVAVSEGHPLPGFAGPVPSSSAIAAARLGLSRNQRDRLLSDARKAGLAELWESAAPDAPQAVETAVQRQTKADELAATKARLKAALRERADEDAVLKLIGRMAEGEAALPTWLDPPAARKGGKSLPEVPIVLWGDWHYGEVVSADETNGYNAFDTAIAQRRVSRLVGATVDVARNHMRRDYPGIVVALLGDFISGGLHPELARTDEEGRLEAALSVRDILCKALTRMADEFGRVFVPAVPGNHGRNTQRPEFKEYHKGNFDWLVYHLVARHFEDKGDKRVRLLIPSSGDAFFRVFGLRFMATHGDMLGVKGGDGIIGAIGPIMRGEIKMRGQQTSLGRSYDVLLMGHWHQTLNLPRAFVNGALKGFDEYAMKSLRAVPAPPSQTLFFVHPKRGITATWPITLDEQATPSAEQWLAFPAGSEVFP